MKSRVQLKQFSQALDNAFDAVVITDTQGVITYRNRLFETLAQSSLERRKDWMIFEFFADQDSFLRAYAGALVGVPVEIDSVLKRDGEEIPVAVKCSAIFDERGAPQGLMFLIFDLTERKDAEIERKRLELELYEAHKLESVGQLASGIAHEINTPVQFVGDNIRFMQDSIQSLFDLLQAQNELLKVAKAAGLNPDVTDAVDRALEIADVEYLQEELPLAISQSLEGVGRVATIVRAMKEFAHPGVEGKVLANLNEAIQTTITVARNRWKYVATLATEFEETLPLVPCLVGEFNQVILNLIVNASDAIGEKMGGSSELGEIKISTHMINNRAEVRVQDTGGGIPEKIQSRIFDPFFTTKEVGQGSGQGLAIARGVVVNKHQGEFSFETEEGIGTTFIIQLPLELSK